MKSWPNNVIMSSWELVNIGPNSHEKLTKKKLGKVIICSNLVSSTLIWPQNKIVVHALLTYIYHYFPIFGII